jgi:CspA family cold shock protein
MPKGIVKWFNNAKGFGFIVEDGGSDDIFAHYSAIDMDGFRTLKAGQPVEFELQQGNKGLHAANIRFVIPDANVKTSATTAQQSFSIEETEHA